MRFSILHISDLHRDLADEVSNRWLLDSLARDFDQFRTYDPKILQPSLCIVSGDLVYGIAPSELRPDQELRRQYDQAESFLGALADRFFRGDRDRVVILPGNHDVCFPDVISALLKVDVPTDERQKAKLVAELFKPQSDLRWSWNDLCFYRVTDGDLYRNRFRYFSSFYERFYQGTRHYPTTPEEQIDCFDFPDVGFSVATLNTCYGNDPFRRSGKVNPDALAEACVHLRSPHRSGWLLGAAWHHNISGGPTNDDYVDASFLQSLIDAGASLGFHGHQHLHDCFDERYRLGPDRRKMTIISAGTLCAEPKNLRPGIPRSYNVVEIDTEQWTGRVCQRQMVNSEFDMPIWGPGRFIATGSPYYEFEVEKPLSRRPSKLDFQLTLETVEKLIGSCRWQEALNAIEPIKNDPNARPFLSKILLEMDEPEITISNLWPPLTNAEAVALGAAILDIGTQEQISSFLKLGIVMNNADASVREIVSRIRERRLK